MQVAAPVTGRRRCRMHGGADGSGAPRGPENGNYKHGRYTAEVAATRGWLREACVYRNPKLGRNGDGVRQGWRAN
jgi:hypothetical protein